MDLLYLKDGGGWRIKTGHEKWQEGDLWFNIWSKQFIFNLNFSSIYCLPLKTQTQEWGPTSYVDFGKWISVLFPMLRSSFRSPCPSFTCCGPSEIGPHPYSSRTFLKLAFRNWNSAICSQNSLMLSVGISECCLLLGISMLFFLLGLPGSPSWISPLELFAEINCHF